MSKAIFGAGCFWKLEEHFRYVFGVVDVSVGYCGGNKDNPTYEEVCSGTTGHAEVANIKFDKSKVGYEDLLRIFFNFHDPTLVNRQGLDVGNQYRSVVFFDNAEQERFAYAAKEKLVVNGVKIATEIVKFDIFWRAEEYHQQFLSKLCKGLFENK
ncbi:peptide methionine sulfoxide reductase A3 [Candidatus Endolissoclinum faulkneri L2]|uniref:Peptide methionine sulfoxide reductase MsrA n=1 Tax=Candidatus Endolissoclinum faulkneri L2 TaxID=1193729 RepID=K7YRD0_9PROT|nr:peptide-methionine (S)-S-oxide reductase MsrA [Candidatus Endolissoclinum faulkneri]AFX99099.1 peptide methionine sulfoxide reductase A3 [Candidatus Endolissoclinum faulkneri L2]